MKSDTKNSITNKLVLVDLTKTKSKRQIELYEKIKAYKEQTAQLEMLQKQQKQLKEFLKNQDFETIVFKIDSENQLTMSIEKIQYEKETMSKDELFNVLNAEYGEKKANEIINKAKKTTVCTRVDIKGK